MDKYILIGIVILLAVGATVTLTPSKKEQATFPSSTAKKTDAPMTAIVAENLDTPWGIAFLPDDSLLVTERLGTVKRITKNGQTVITTLPNVQESGEGGLLGITLHPHFANNKYVYLYYTYSNNGNNTLNRVVRMTYKDNQLVDEKIIVDQIPGASNHNGGRIKFGPDSMLYISSGDAQQPSLAQDKNSLAGKILRVTDEGKSAPGNPFKNAVFSYGHRNVQGLAWNKNGALWATEHGRSGFQSGLDELNQIQAGGNYGWPTIQGDETKEGMQTPQKNSDTTTWAPAGAAFVDDALYFGGLRGSALYKATINGNQVTNLQAYFNGEYGRIREVILGPNGMLYITTSNKDGRGLPKSGDDKIIQINPERL